VHQLGGYKVQGKTTESADQLKADALRCRRPAPRMLVLEAIPSRWARK
jgi:3-methyl-2-oxobutanoate hydroxymethyltransferase